MKNSRLLLLIGFMAMGTRINAQEQSPPAKQDADALAKKLSNPIASLISLPFQNNLDVGIGQYNGSRNTLNIQPVVPFRITPKLNLITRAILPVIAQYDIYQESSQQSGLGDAVVSAFFSPAEAPKGFVWGLGPVFLLPVATDDLLGAKQFGIGPTLVVLKQVGPWTLGLLGNQIWSAIQDPNRNNVNQMFLQPFLFHNWKSGAGLGINSEITQNWENNSTTVFLNPVISGLSKFGTQIFSLAIGPRIQLASAANGKCDFGIRGVLTLVFPK